VPNFVVLDQTIREYNY